jgi:hypothetical protein
MVGTETSTVSPIRNFRFSGTAALKGCPPDLQPQLPELQLPEPHPPDPRLLSLSFSVSSRLSTAIHDSPTMETIAFRVISLPYSPNFF